jgi:hypothetical protein
LQYICKINEAATYEIFIFPKKEYLRKKISISLFFLIGISVFGPYPVLKLLQWQAKETTERIIRQQIPVNELQVFVNPVSDKDIVWEEEDEEFYYKGNMYDVVKKEVKDGKTFYYCYNDQKEATVFAGLENLVYKQMNESHSSSDPVQKYFSKLFVQVFLLSDRLAIPSNPLAEVYNRQHYLLHPYNNVSVEIISPPPKSGTQL